MTGKSIAEAKRPANIVDLKAKVEARYKAVAFDHPNYDFSVEVAMLKSGERQAIIVAATRPDGTLDGVLTSRMAVAYGLVSPRLAETPEEVTELLKEYPDDFIDPIARKVWDLTNNYIANRTGGSAPFSKRTSGSSTGSSTEPTSPPT